MNAHWLGYEVIFSRCVDECTLVKQQLKQFNEFNCFRFDAHPELREKLSKAKTTELIHETIKDMENICLV